MKIAILETGGPPGDACRRVRRLSRHVRATARAGFEFETFDVQTGDLPEPRAHDAYLITGSPAGVYEPLPWIAPLMQFIRAANDSKMVGVCFGHQVMAEALGGHVEQSRQGLGRGAAPLLDRARASRGWTARGDDRDARFAPGPGRRPAAEHRRDRRGSDFTPFAGARLDRPAGDLLPVPSRNSRRLSPRR